MFGSLLAANFVILTGFIFCTNRRIGKIEKLVNDPENEALTNKLKAMWLY